MRNSFKQNNKSKPKCNACNSENIKKRKNYSHGNSSKGKISYSCSDCGSSDVSIPQSRPFRRR